MISSEKNIKEQDTQSALGRYLNKVMLETGESPMEVMGTYMDVSAPCFGSHTFVTPSKAQREADK